MSFWNRGLTDQEKQAKQNTVGAEFDRKVGGFFSVGGEVAKGIYDDTAKIFKNLGESGATALGEFTGLNESIQKDTQKSISSNQETLRILRERLKKESDAVKAQQIKNSIANIEKQNSDILGGTKDFFDKAKSNVDPGHVLDNAAQLALLIASAGTASTAVKGGQAALKTGELATKANVARNVTKAANGGLEIMTPLARAEKALNGSRIATGANAIVNPTSVKEGALAFGAVGGAQSGLMAAEDPNANPLTVAQAVVPGVAVGGALGGFAGGLSGFLAKRAPSRVTAGSPQVINSPIETAGIVGAADNAATDIESIAAATRAASTVDEAPIAQVINSIETPPAPKPLPALSPENTVAAPSVPKEITPVASPMTLEQLAMKATEDVPSAAAKLTPDQSKYVKTEQQFLNKTDSYINDILSGKSLSAKEKKIASTARLAGTNEADNSNKALAHILNDRRKNGTLPEDIDGWLNDMGSVPDLDGMGKLPFTGELHTYHAETARESLANELDHMNSLAPQVTKTETLYHGTNVELPNGKPTTGQVGTRAYGRKVKSEMVFFSDNKKLAQFFADDRTKGLGGKASVGEYDVNTSKLLDFTDDWTEEGLKKNLKKLGYYDKNGTYASSTPMGINGDITSLFDSKEFKDRLVKAGYTGVKFNEKGHTAFAVIDDSLISAKTPTPQVTKTPKTTRKSELATVLDSFGPSNAPKPTRKKSALATKVDEIIAKENPELLAEKTDELALGEGGVKTIPRMHVEDLKQYLGHTEDIPASYKRTTGERDIDLLAQRAGYDEVDDYIDAIKQTLDTRKLNKENAKKLAGLRRDPKIVAKAKKSDTGNNFFNDLGSDKMVQGHPFDKRSVIYLDGKGELRATANITTRSDGSVNLNSIEALDGGRKGSGGELIDRMKASADKNNKNIYLKADPSLTAKANGGVTKGMNKKQLVEFYKKKGFVQDPNIKSNNALVYYANSKALPVSKTPKTSKAKYMAANAPKKKDLGEVSMPLKQNPINDNEAFTLADYGEMINPNSKFLKDTTNPLTIDSINKLHVQARHAAKTADLDITSGSSREIQDRIISYLEQRDATQVTTKTKNIGLDITPGKDLGEVTMDMPTMKDEDVLTSLVDLGDKKTKKNAIELKALGATDEQLRRVIGIDSQGNKLKPMKVVDSKATVEASQKADIVKTDIDELQSIDSGLVSTQEQRDIIEKMASETPEAKPSWAHKVDDSFASLENTSQHLTKKLGKFGADLSDTMSKSWKQAADMKGALRENLYTITKLAKKEIGTTQAERLAFGDKLVKALESRDSSGLKTDGQKAIYDNIVIVLDYIKAERVKRGLPVLEKYSPHEMIKDFNKIQDGLESAFTTKGVRIESKHSLPRLKEDLGDMANNNILDILPNYVNSQINDLAFSPTKKMWQEGVTNIPTHLTRNTSEFSAAVNYAQNALIDVTNAGPTSTVGRMIQKLSNYYYTNVLYMNPKNIAYSQLQKLQALAETTSEQRAVANKASKEIRELFKSKLSYGEATQSQDAAIGANESRSALVKGLKKADMNRASEASAVNQPYLWKAIGTATESPIYKNAIKSGKSIDDALRLVTEDPATMEACVRAGNVLVEGTMFGANTFARPAVLRSSNPVVKALGMFQRFSIAETNYIRGIIKPGDARMIDVLMRGDVKGTTIAERIMAHNSYLGRLKETRTAQLSAIKNGTELRQKFSIKTLNEMISIAENAIKSDHEALKAVSYISGPKRAAAFSAMWAGSAAVATMFNGALNYGNPDYKAADFGQSMINQDPTIFSKVNPWNRYSIWKSGLSTPLNPINQYGLNARGVLNIIPGGGIIDRASGSAVSSNMSSWLKQK